MMIDIKGLNKAEVLKTLYDHSHIQGLGFLQEVPPPPGASLLWTIAHHCWRIVHILITCTDEY